MKHVPCNTMENLCPLPRPPVQAAQAPRPHGAAGKELGSARLWLHCLHQFIFLAWPHLTVGQLTQ